MKKLSILIYFFTYCFFAQSSDSLKIKAAEYISKLQPSLFDISETVWSYSEPSFMDHRTSKLYKTILVEEGFSLEENIGGYPTMFIASFGNKGPIIGILAEADADSPLEPIEHLDLPNSDFGHGAGHHLLGTGSLGAALVLKKLVEKEKIDAQIRFLFSSGEGSLGGRVPMVKNGHFDHMDLAFFWHPAPVTSANLSKWDALIDLEITYAGANALKNAMILVNYFEQLKKEHSTDALLRAKIQNTAYNLAVPDDSVKLQLRIQHSTQEEAISIFSSLKKYLETQKKDIQVQWKVFRGLHEFIPTLSGNQLAYHHISALEKRKVTNKDIKLSNLIYQLASEEKGLFLTDPLPFKKQRSEGLYGYASDIGDVSWQVPLISFVIGWIPSGLSMQNWEAAAFGNSEYAKAAMIHAIKTITFTTLDYLSNPDAQKQIKLEFDTRKKGRHYFDEIEIHDLPASKEKRSY
ncbi:hypothetical protein [Flagellimonas sp. 2504JD1-5]